MQQLNEQLLITFECVSAIGTSLQLREMMEHFLKVFSRKMGALASIYWTYDTKHNRTNSSVSTAKKRIKRSL